MKRVYSSQDPGLVQSLRTVLESRGIPCEVRGVERSIAMGELPPIECWPELWVTDDARVEEAEGIAAVLIPSDHATRQRGPAGSV